MTENDLTVIENVKDILDLYNRDYYTLKGRKILISEKSIYSHLLNSFPDTMRTFIRVDP